MGADKPHIYEFGDFRLDSARRLLLRRDDNQPVKLTAKAFDTLSYMVRHSGTVLDKDELMRAVWPDTVVEENNLSQSVSALRRALGERQGENHYIATVPGRGFSFVAEVRIGVSKGDGLRAESPEDQIGGSRKIVEDKDVPQPIRPKVGRRGRLWPAVLICIIVAALAVGALYLWRTWTAMASSGQIRTIAVLPFKPLTPGNRDEALELGMADTLINRLSNIRGVVVSPISSIRRYGGLEQDPLAAGRELGVESVLDGTIQRSGGRIRVTVRLVRVSDGSPLWAGQFDDEFTNLFSVLDSMSLKVAESLTLKLTGAEQQQLTRRHTDNAEAYELYQKGRLYWYKSTPEDFRRSREYFQRAIDVDPSYALAYAGLGDAYGYPASYGLLRPDVWAKHEALVLKALKLDPTLPDAHNSLAALKLYYYRDWPGAESELKRAIELNPNYAEAHHHYGTCLSLAGHQEEALAEVRRAQMLEPLSLRINRNMGRVFFYARRYDEAAAQYGKTLELDGNDSLTHEMLGDALEQKGDYDGAVAEWRTAMVLSKDEELAVLLERAYKESGFERMIKAVAGRRLERLTEKVKRGEFVPAAEFARAYIRLGDREQALAWLERAYEERNRLVLEAAVDPAFDTLRGDVRFQKLQDSLGLKR